MNPSDTQTFLENAQTLLGGGIGIALLILTVVAAIMWFLFPIFVYSYLKGIRAELTRIRKALEDATVTREK